MRRTYLSPRATPERMSERTLYERLGGRDGIADVVDAFYDRVFADDRVNHHFEGVDTEALYAHQVQFISAVAGGPVEYDGQDMREAHAHLDITEPEFDAVAAHLDAALEEKGVPDADRESVLAEVASLEEPIVNLNH